MKNIIIVITICALGNFVFAQNLGINRSNPTQKLDVGGWIEVGNETTGSTATTGTIRYHSSGKLQFYNGSSWANLGGTFTNFIRWGVNSCPGGSSLVYTGYVGGKRYNHLGSGANTLCMTNNPNYTGISFNDGNQDGALIYGAEFQVSSNQISTITNRHDYDASCAVCKVTDASVTMMIPGTNACPSGWSRQYWGYLMATHFTQNKGEFVCVDNAPSFTGSNANSDGLLWYPTEAELGSLSGTPYVQDRELTCAVCTR